MLGGTGFLGRAIAARFAATFRVRIFSRRPPAATCPFEYQTGDIADRAALRRALAGAAYVLHLASDSLPGPSNEDPGRDAERSLSDGISVLDSCIDAGVRCVLYPSTGGAVYGAGAEEPFDEDAATDPVSSYGITRLAMEKYLALYRRLHGLDHRILRISNAYGPGQPNDRTQGLIAVALARCLSGEVLTVWGDGSAVRDYVYVEDVAEAFLAASRELNATSPRSFNIGSGQGHSVREVLALVERITGRPLRVVWKETRACDPGRIVLSTRRAQAVLGWNARTTLEDGIQAMWERATARALP